MRCTSVYTRVAASSAQFSLGEHLKAHITGPVFALSLPAGTDQALYLIFDARCVENLLPILSLC